MFLLKVAVGLSCIIACVKIAKLKAENLKNATKFWQAIIDLCNDMLINLSYQKHALKVLFSKDYKFNDFNEFLKIYDKTGDFEFPSYLLEDEKELLNSFFIYLGKSDSEAQKQFVLAKKNLFLKVLDEKVKIQNKQYSVTLKIGFFIGVMLFVMVI